MKKSMRRLFRRKRKLFFLAVLILLHVSRLTIVFMSTLTNSGLSADYGLLEEFGNNGSPVSIDIRKLPRTAIKQRRKVLPSCPSQPTSLRGKVDVNGSAPTNFPDLVNGGSFQPKDCKARYKVAIIIPNRDREVQQSKLLHHMHPIWQRQEIEYTVYSITQAGTGIFNKAKLMNAGVAEAMREKDYDCYVFHDVDMLLEDDRCLYWCDEENPRHLSRYVDIFSYQPVKYLSFCIPGYNPLKYVHLFGGVTMLTKKQFLDVNGYSNLYWGWGAEDDDMFFRMWNKGYNGENPFGEVCSYTMIKHDRDPKNKKNDVRDTLLYHSASRADEEGFNTLRYKRISKERNPLFTRITVDIGHPSKKMKEYMSAFFSWMVGCALRVPWKG